MLLLPSVGDKTRKGRVDKTGLIRGVMGHSIGVFGSGTRNMFAPSQGSVCVAGLLVVVPFPRQVVCWPAIGPW